MSAKHLGSRSRPISKTTVLARVASGQLAVSELLDVLLPRVRIGPANSELRELMKCARARDYGPIRVRPPRQVPPALIRAALEEARRQMPSFGAIDVTWGARNTAGAWSETPALIFFVPRKGVRGEGMAAIPPELPVQRGRKTFRFPTDVLEVPSLDLQAPVEQP